MTLLHVWTLHIQHLTFRLRSVVTLVLTQIRAEVWTHTSLKRCGSESFGQRKLDIRFRYTTASATAAATTAMTKNVTTAATHGGPGSAEQSDMSLFVTLLHCCRSTLILLLGELTAGGAFTDWCAGLAWLGVCPGVDVDLDAVRGPVLQFIQNKPALQ